MWQVVEGAHAGDRSVTEWLAVPGGRIYRSVWLHDADPELMTLKGTAMVFVPDHPAPGTWATTVE